MSTPSRRARLGSATIIVRLATVYFLVRMLDLDRFVTSDEPLWLGRSANFLTALLNGDPAGTFQFAHPGVMTMWSGAIAIWLVAPDYASAFSTPIHYVFNIHMRLREIGEDPLAIMTAARVSNVLLQTVIFTIAVSFLHRHYGADGARGTAPAGPSLFPARPGGARRRDDSPPHPRLPG